MNWLIQFTESNWVICSWIWLNSKRLQQLNACWKENVQWKLANICTCSSKKHIGFKRPETLIHVNYFNESFMSLLKLECFSPVHCNFMEIRHHMLSFVFHEGQVNDWIYILGDLFHCSLTDLHFFQFYMILQLHITNARCKCCTTKKKKYERFWFCAWEKRQVKLKLSSFNYHFKTKQPWDSCSKVFFPAHRSARVSQTQVTNTQKLRLSSHTLSV